MTPEGTNSQAGRFHKDVTEHEIMLENDLSPTVLLDGEWEFQLGDSPARRIVVPSAWEATTRDKLSDGPALYRRQFNLPESSPGAAIVLEADAISFEAAVRVNGQPIGTHRGMWSPFQCDITPCVRVGDNTLEIEVWKPGGRFPVRETLSGFLPDVATTFGGIWQGIRLRAFERAALSDLRVFAYGGGWVGVQGRVVNLGERRHMEVGVELRDAENRPVARMRGPVAEDRSFAAQLETHAAAQWKPGERATLYSVRVSLYARRAEIAGVARRIGFRSLAAAQGRILLNGAPRHLRGVLDWGWDPTRICPAPDRAQVLDQIAKARALGFNLIKLCLFVPDETTFDVADEEGMLLWLEMPMWLPRLTPAVRDLAVREYRDVFRRLHHHPSIAIVSLGCELNSEAGADFLDELDRLARAWFPNALHCDNSGSAEAYGGVVTSLSDFYDYHFYTDPHFFQPLVQHFKRPYRPSKPWIYGEFCDADTLRDFNRLDPAPWWLTDETLLARDDFVATREYKRRLRAAHVADGGAGLTRAARRQATAIRKFLLERVRADGATGGYVVTGWADTPITTSGVVDDDLALKFAPAEWKQFNDDCVLTIDRERRRRWLGGDRPAYKDPFTWWQGETAEIHIIVSNGAGDIERGKLDWQLDGAGTSDAASGSVEVSNLPGGEVREAAVLSLPVPVSTDLRPIELTLRAALRTVDGAAVSENSWRLWGVPRSKSSGPIAVVPSIFQGYDFAAIIADSMDAAESDGATGRPLVATELTDDLLERVRAGASALVWLTQPDARFCRQAPFWREAIHVFEGHALWERVPHENYADMRFFSLATDIALDPGRLAATLGGKARLAYAWRRFDARALTWADYLIEAALDRGRMFISTLRFAGGLGCQPNTFETNPMGSWMLASLLEELMSQAR